MSFSREEPNPLRPYAVPPSFQPAAIPSSSPAPPGSHSRVNSSKPQSSARTSYGSGPRDILSELDYGDYLPEASPSVTEMIKRLADQGVWRYSSVLLAQPFEVAKVVLQVQDANAIGSSDKSKGKVKVKRGRKSSYHMSSDESENDSQSYFTSGSLSQALLERRRRRTSGSPSRSPSPIPSPPSDRSTAHVHNLSSASSVTAAISSLWAHEGAWGVWKGTNSTFIHNILHSTITSFFRSLIFAVMGLPDAGASAGAFTGPSTLSSIDISTSSAPLLSLFAAVTASGLAGLVLAPVDIARTKIILTPSTHPPRSIIPTLRNLKSWLVPTSIAPVTLLHSILPTFVATSTPIFLRLNLGIDPVLTPTAYAAATFVSQTAELGMRLPVETVLRRGQMAVIRESEASSGASRRPSSQHATPTQTIVDVGAYHGLVGTMYNIVFEEGTREGKVGNVAAGRTLNAKKRKGQGLPGLFRGWRVGIWGLVGVWGAATLGGGKSDEF